MSNREHSIEETPSDVGQNSEAVFQALFEQMMTHHRTATEAGAAKADEIALDLIKHAELPLLFRVRAHMVPASGNNAEYMWHAREAVRVAEMGISLFGEGHGSSTGGPAALLADARETLRRAERDFTHMENQRKELEAEGYEVFRGEPEDGEVVEVVRFGGQAAETCKFNFSYFCCHVRPFFQHHRQGQKHLYMIWPQPLVSAVFRSTHHRL